MIALSNIYDEAFFRKQLPAKTCQLFSHKSSIVGVSQGPLYATEVHVTLHMLQQSAFPWKEYVKTSYF